MSDDLSSDPRLTGAYAKTAIERLTTQPPGQTWPKAVLLGMTCIPRRKAQLREWWARRRSEGT